ncbi:hypothetical protein BDY17DRAFT_324579 [Neohortaea acidophila]|uniref:Lipase B n=1 Tax=Neohortaea acidophila TaxID=245834 RepID=A0A6A6PRL1_9PEZI|nr:uncharacterized protein BDY17DRAFT_324579 [Neohortaea acidophila]KAF2482284.1 hypothetical protein BDY17DRAFT_324579 [Neohortaea acidophila]
MASFSRTFTFLALLNAFANAAPTLGSSLSGLEGDVNSVLSSVTSITATATPTSPAEASSIISSIFNAVPTPSSYLQAAEQLVAAGLTTENFVQAIQFLEDPLPAQASDQNVNLRNPTPPAYPQAGPNDAPYDLTEAQLRAAIYIPSTFKYGAKGAPQPAILVPGTGNVGYQTFEGNYIPLLQGSNIADPVWLNIPGFLLNDAQTNSEYVAYAINYIYGISNRRKVAVLAWSQGNINAQWAYKYWPSTRGRVTDHIGFSPDYHGTILTQSPSRVPEPPSFIQQAYNSQFIATLRANGGDAAYVPTTTIYSGFLDEIVEPQQGTGASGYLLSSSSAAASNNEVQVVCAGKPAGSFYTHEGTLYNPLGFALLKDALTHSGPGQASRLDLNTVCSTYLTPGLDLADFLLTEDVIVDAVVATGLYPHDVTTEPPIKPYAQ